MTDKIITLLVGVLIALGGWTLTRTFDLSTNQAVNNELSCNQNSFIFA